jgi:hypothetical protein
MSKKATEQRPASPLWLVWKWRALFVFALAILAVVTLVILDAAGVLNLGLLGWLL